MKILAVFLWIFSSRGVIGLLGLSILLHTCVNCKYYLLALIYLIWVILYKALVLKGMRMNSNFPFRHWRIWRYFCEYFPIRLVKTCELSPQKNYIFACHPHGVFAFGTFGNFATDGTNVGQSFPGLSFHFLMHGLPLKLPFSEILTALGIMSVDASSLDNLLEAEGQGKVAALIPGGLQEVSYARPGQNIRLHLKNRKGFVKMAIKHGASLVPVFTFGENESFEQVQLKKGNLFHDICEYLGLHLLLPNGRGIFGYQLPAATPIISVVGEPLDVPRMPEPTKEVVDGIHKKYMDALVKLFKDYNPKYGAPDLKVEIH